jgi:hypothetical protein
MITTPYRIIVFLVAGTALAFAQPAFDPTGRWNWRCCQGRHSGTFTIDRVNRDGSFLGAFGNSADDTKTPLSGRISGMRMEFIRSYPESGNQTQKWAATIVTEGGNARTTNGTCSGYGLATPQSFEAGRVTEPPRPAAKPEPVRTPAPPPSGAVGSSLVGQWRWTCCAGIHTGTFRIEELTAEGHFHGTFGTSPADGSSPFAGTHTGGVVVFTRFVLEGGKPFRQQWRARIGALGGEMSDGRLSGYGLVGTQEFRATRIR